MIRHWSDFIADLNQWIKVFLATNLQNQCYKIDKQKRLIKDHQKQEWEHFLIDLAK